MCEIFQLLLISFKEVLWNYNGVDENINTLQGKIEELKCREMDVNATLEEEFQAGKKRKRQVLCWLRNVKGKNNEFQHLKQEVQQSLNQGGRFVPGFMRFYTRLRLAKDVDKMKEEVDELLKKGEFGEGLSLNAYKIGRQLFLTPEMVGEAFSRNFQEILAFLKNNASASVGIHGMAGVGKTTLAKHIHNDLMNSKSCGHVFWVTFEKNFSIQKLQNNIANCMHVDLSDEDDENKRAAKLSKECMRRKKFVLIFDDLWKHFDVKKVGIPFEMVECKLILTTRSMSICRLMSCKEIVQVNPLRRNEAFDLFMERLGHGTKLSPEFIELAIRVANKCGGLPLAIETMATSMREVDHIHEWRNVLEELEISITGHEKMETEVFPILKSCYSCLKDTKLQFCFLYCAIFCKKSRFIREGELIHYLIAEGLMDERKTMQAAFDMGKTLLDKLARHNLILSFSFYGLRTHEMHDLLIDMAFRVIREDFRWMIIAEEKLTKIPTQKEWTKDLEKVFLMNKKISDIPPGISPRCPRLTTLMLQNNPLKWIPDSLFEHLCGLRVLNLRYTMIEKLPESISDLENLRALLVGCCRRLKYVPPLGNLRELRELDLLGTEIHELPEGAKNLVNLKIVGMDGIGHLEKLKNLEEFSGNLSLNEYNQLLKFEIRLRRFALDISQERYPSISISSFYEGNNFVNFFRRNFKKNKLLLPEGIQRLKIRCCWNMGRCLSYTCPSLNKAWELKECELYDCEEIECILRLSLFSDETAKAEEESCLPPLQRPEELSLQNLPNFTALCQREGAIAPAPAPLLPRGAFSSLKVLNFNGCPNLKAPFTPRLLQHFLNLETLRIVNCEGLEEIIAEDEVEGEGMGGSSSSSGQSSYDSTLTHPKSWEILLHSLRNLRRISRRSLSFIRQIEVFGCPELKTIPFVFSLVDGQLSAPPNLELFVIDEMMWNLLERDHHGAKNVLQPFVRII